MATWSHSLAVLTLVTMAPMCEQLHDHEIKPMGERDDDDACVCMRADRGRAGDASGSPEEEEIAHADPHGHARAKGRPQVRQHPRLCAPPPNRISTSAS